MRKAILIAAGTVTGLGAVLSITPPAMSDSVGTLGLPAGNDLGGAAATPAATPTQSATTTAKPTVVATPTQAAPTTAFSGTVNGASFTARDYGTVSVSVTFSNGKFKSVSAQQNPTMMSGSVELRRS